MHPVRLRRSGFRENTVICIPVKTYSALPRRRYAPNLSVEGSVWLQMVRGHEKNKISGCLSFI